MSRRIEVELTSARGDGVWTWRAAGAREPKGVVDGHLLPAGAKVGDVLRAEADFDVEGISIVSVLPPKGDRKEPERLELLGSRDFQPVTQTLASRRNRPRRLGEGPSRERTERGPRPEGAVGRPPRERGERPDRRPRPEGVEPRPPRERRERPPRPPVPELPARPKPKRLRAGHAHRNELLAELPDEVKPITEQLLRGGMPAVRQALDAQNERLRSEGRPEIKPTGVLALAEELLPKVRVAEWLDRAEAARSDLDELDLRDLRSVVVAGADPMVARDERTSELAAQLKDGLANRQEKEHQDWLADVSAALDVGRSIRALRLSSRPPKAGVPFPPDLATRLAEATLATLTPDATSDRWVAVIEALAYSPVRSLVVPVEVPATVTDDLRATVTRYAALLPDLARRFGIEPPPPGSRPPRPPRPARKPDKKPPAASAPRPGPAATPPVEAPHVEAPVVEEAAVEEAAVEPLAEPAVAEAPPEPGETTSEADVG